MKLALSILTILISNSAVAINYETYIPSSLDMDKKHSLVVLMHGCGQNSSLFLRQTKMKAHADKKGLVVLSLNKGRSLLTNPLGCWGWYWDASMTRSAKIGDLANSMRIIEKVITTNNIDRDNVFVIGFSAGGAMASVMASCYPDVFRGVLNHAGGGYKTHYFAHKDLKLNIGDIHKHKEHGLDLGHRALACGLNTIKREDYKLDSVIIGQGQRDRLVWPRNGRRAFLQFSFLDGDFNTKLLYSESSDYRYYYSHNSLIETEYFEFFKLKHGFPGGGEGIKFSAPWAFDITDYSLNKWFTN